MNRFNREDFLRAFQEEWLAQVHLAPEVLTSPEYPALGDWTRFVLGPGGLLEGVMLRLQRVVPNLSYIQGRYTVDCSYVGGKELFGSGMHYPSQIHCLIEHEHGNKVEEEMWKLIHWRAPLKVLIFYDWNQWEKTSESRREWLSMKLAKLWSMVRDVDAHFPENCTTEYLLLVGNRQQSNQPPIWSFSVSETTGTQPFIQP